MIPAAVALASAACWGTSDFLGGLSARRISPFQTVALAHAISLCGILVAIAALHLHGPTHHTILLALTAGLFGGGGLVLFYQALSLGSMGLTAAIAGVLTAAVPVLYGLSTEGLPRPLQLAGFVTAIVSIWMIAAAPSSGRAQPRTLALGAIAGTCFGIYFVLLKLAGETGSPLPGVLWAMAFSRIGSASLASLLCLWFALQRKPAALGQWSPLTFTLAAAVGFLDMGGNLLYMAATRLGRLDVAAVLSSLYPAVTILLAAAFLQEKTTRSQSIGMALALGSVALIAS